MHYATEIVIACPSALINKPHKALEEARVLNSLVLSHDHQPIRFVNFIQTRKLDREETELFAESSLGDSDGVAVC